MKTMFPTPPARARVRVRACAVIACALAPVLGGTSAASAQVSQPAPTTDPSGITATLEQCVTSTVQAERSATFAGEMAEIPGAARMAVRIDVEERLPGEMGFHTVSAPGLGVWRPADPKVKVYKYLKQVTNLSAPASYRGYVRFRWLSARGHVVKRAERLTARCLQPAPPAEAPPVVPSGPTAPSLPSAPSAPSA